MKRKIRAVLFSVAVVVIITLIWPNFIHEKTTTAVEAIDEENVIEEDAVIEEDNLQEQEEENLSEEEETETEESNAPEEKEEEEKIEKDNSPEEKEEEEEVVTSKTVINGILLVNKTYALPANYNPGEDAEATNQLHKMFDAAKEEIGKKLLMVSGFRSYDYQKGLYDRYVARDGEEKASTYSAKPGHSEHQTGLAFDIGGEDQSRWVNDSFAGTQEAEWLKENAHKFGYILRYPKDKTYITGYKYEPWHFRYVGVEHATAIYEQDITLEEYLLGENY